MSEKYKKKLLRCIEKMKQAIFNSRFLTRLIENHFELENFNGITEEEIE